MHSGCDDRWKTQSVHPFASDCASHCSRSPLFPHLGAIPHPRRGDAAAGVAPAAVRSAAVSVSIQVTFHILPREFLPLPIDAVERGAAPPA